MPRSAACSWSNLVRSSLLASIVPLSACAEDEVVQTPEQAAAPKVDWRGQLADGPVQALLDALAQRHHTTRAALGDHRLEYRARFDLVPADPPPEPQVGQKIPTEQHLEDHLVLEWVAEEADPPEFRLRQDNDQGRSRAMIVIDEQVYTRQYPRSWLKHPLETELYELWLDDAQHAVLDVVALAAPRLDVTVEQASNHADTIELQLNRSSEPTGHEPPSDGPGRGWRSAATIDTVEGTITLDARSGVWLSADLQVEYRVPGEQPLRGSVTLTGTIQREPDRSSITPPDGANPVPQRVRYRPERERLLDGVAAP